MRGYGRPAKPGDLREFLFGRQPMEAAFGGVPGRRKDTE